MMSKFYQNDFKTHISGVIL